MNKEENNPSKCPICERPTHKESKYCIFHASAEDKTEEEFKNALKEYIQEIKEGDKDYNFKEFIFVGSANFKKDLNITVFKNARFDKTTFERYANFRETTFKGDAVFKKATFKGVTLFNKITFEGCISFREATFEEDAVFKKITFQGHAVFREAIFKGVAFFQKTTFEGYANFRESTFKGDAVFRQAIFKGDANFKLKYLVKIINFSRINVFSGKRLFIKLNNEGGKIYFVRAQLENTYLDIEIVEGISIDFNGAILKDTKIKKDQIKNHILQEKKKEYYKAQEIFLLLKNNFHSIGQYEDESWAFTKEKDMERKSYCHFKTLHRWLWSCFLNAIYGYGERPWNVAITAGVVILFFALFFSIIGIGNPEIIEIKGTAIQQTSGNIVDLAFKGSIKNNVIRNFLDSLYFSTITFTTLGYGDFRPLEGLGRILAGSEAFIGAFMMALFVYTFARRTGGR